MDEERRDSLPSPASLQPGHRTSATHFFSFFAAIVARRSGHIAPFIVATLLVLLWMLERFPVWLNRDSHGRRNSGVFGQRFGFERVPWPDPIRRTCASAL
jgi:hypothetical protein